MEEEEKSTTESLKSAEKSETELSAGLLTAVDTANVVQAVKTVSSSHIINAGELTVKVDTSAKVRRSTRDIRRPKFDDELVQSGSVKHSPRKRNFPDHRSPEPTEDTPRGVPPRKAPRIASPAGDSIQTAPTSLNIQPGASSSVVEVAKPADGKADNKPPAHHPTKHFVQDVPPAESENGLVVDRRKRERLAAGRAAQHTANGNKQSLGRSANDSTGYTESMKRWTAEDDVALVAAVTHVSDIRAVYNYVKFSKNFSLLELEERWYELMYDENVSRVARRRMDQLGRDRIAHIQAGVPLSTDEEELLRAVPSTAAVADGYDIFESLLAQNRAVFHHVRTAKALESHYRELRNYGLLYEQSGNGSVPQEHELFEAEKHFDLGTLVEGDGPLDIEERNATRNVVVAEREMQEWDRVFVNNITGVQEPTRMPANVSAVLRGRVVTFEIAKEKVLIGRSTQRHRVDVNLTLEGPSGRVSRKQAMLKQDDNGDFTLINLGKRVIYVNGKACLQNEKATLIHNSVIEIALIRLLFQRNENYRRQTAGG